MWKMVLQFTTHQNTQIHTHKNVFMIQITFSVKIKKYIYNIVFFVIYTLYLGVFHCGLPTV